MLYENIGVMGFRGVWRAIQREYLEGRVVSERDLQARIICEMKQLLSGPMRIMAEPAWKEADNFRIPDIVIASDSRITDIFELKFVPHGYADPKDDLAKLVEYSSAGDRHRPVSLEPLTGQWAKSIPLAKDCRFHFIAVSNFGAAAVWPESLADEVPRLAQYLKHITHWFGRTGRNDAPNNIWDIAPASNKRLESDA